MQNGQRQGGINIFSPVGPEWRLVGGGDMIKSVTFEKTTYADLPGKFEAGTPHIAGAIGLAARPVYMQVKLWSRFAKELAAESLYDEAATEPD